MVNVSGEESTYPARIEVGQVVVPVVPLKRQPHMAFLKIDHLAVLRCHGKMFTRWLSNGGRYLNLVTQLFGLTS